MGFMLSPPAWSHLVPCVVRGQNPWRRLHQCSFFPKEKLFLPSFPAVCGFVSQGPSGYNWDSRNANNFQNPLVALLNDAIWRLQLITGLRNIQD